MVTEIGQLQSPNSIQSGFSQKQHKLQRISLVLQRILQSTISPLHNTTIHKQHNPQTIYRNNPIYGSLIPAQQKTSMLKVYMCMTQWFHEETAQQDFSALFLAVPFIHYMFLHFFFFFKQLSTEDNSKHLFSQRPFCDATHACHSPRWILQMMKICQSQGFLTQPCLEIKTQFFLHH